ncbi:unnamed protein product [Orchesella dallaii]|uniref:Uncharacterized protein n=1 Tax=Orchesella dallaii TaxID=48710 RepID=A0ABP1S1C5_9HEXA
MSCLSEKKLRKNSCVRLAGIQPGITADFLLVLLASVTNSNGQQFKLFWKQFGKLKRDQMQLKSCPSTGYLIGPVTTVRSVGKRQDLLGTGYICVFTLVPKIILQKYQTLSNFEFGMALWFTAIPPFWAAFVLVTILLIVVHYLYCLFFVVKDYVIDVLTPTTAVVVTPQALKDLKTQLEKKLEDAAKQWKGQSATTLEEARKFTTYAHNKTEAKLKELNTAFTDFSSFAGEHLEDLRKSHSTEIAKLYHEVELYDQHMEYLEDFLNGKRMTRPFIQTITNIILERMNQHHQNTVPTSFSYPERRPEPPQPQQNTSSNYRNLTRTPPPNLQFTGPESLHFQPAHSSPPPYFRQSNTHIPIPVFNATLNNVKFLRN